MTLARLDLACFFDVYVGDRRIHAHGFGLQRGIEGEKDGTADHARQRRADDRRAMAAHQHGGVIAECLRKVMTERRVADQHVRHAGFLADFEHGDAEGDEGRAVVHRLERYPGIAEGDQRRRMRVHHRHHVRSRLVDFAVDEALGIQCRQRQPVCVNGSAVEIEFQYVFRGDKIGRHAPRHQISVWVLVVSHRNVTPPVEQAVIGKNAIGGNQILHSFGVGRSGGSRRGRLRGLCRGGEANAEGE